MGVKVNSQVKETLQKQNDRHCPQDVNFTLAELRAAIPPHCFERSLARSLFHVFVDLFVISSLGFIGQLYDYSQYSSRILLVDVVFWNVIWFLQGIFWAGIWVLAHECGHGGFSKYQKINNVVGFVLHSLVLIPYFAWRTSHKRHHAATQHFERDQVYIPHVGTSKEVIKEALEQSPIVDFLKLAFALFLGWPMYLFFNAWGQKYPTRTNHFEPSSPIFSASQKWEIIASNLGLIAVILANVYLAYTTSFMTMMKIFGVPYLWVNLWMILITYLHHTDEKVPFFKDSTNWNFVRGAICTIDRDYGWFLNVVFHHITDTHVVHHLFSSLPFYHAKEATEHLKKKLGKHYLFDDTPFYIALWRTWRRCAITTESEDSMLYYVLDK